MIGAGFSLRLYGRASSWSFVRMGVAPNRQPDTADRAQNSSRGMSFSPFTMTSSLVAECRRDPRERSPASLRC